MTDAEVMARYDQEAESAVAGTAYYLEEMVRRRVDRQTRTIARLTWVVTVATLVMLVLAGVSTWAVVDAR